MYGIITVYGYTIRDSKVGRTNQPNRRLHKICMFLVFCLCTCNPLSAVIVLETPQTEVLVVVTDRKGERNNTPASSLSFPLCSIAVKAKHQGRGYLEVTHTPLVFGSDLVPYQLFCDTREMILPTALPYECNSFLPLTIPMTELSVMLSRPLLRERSLYTSVVFLHLKLEA